MKPNSEKIGIPQAKEMIWNYSVSVDPNNPVPHSLIFDAPHVSAVVDQQYSALNQDNQVLSVEQQALKRKLKEILSALQLVSHVRFYFALNSGQFTLIMVGVDYVNGQYLDRLVGTEPEVYEFARPCPPYQCGDMGSRLIDDRFKS